MSKHERVLREHVRKLEGDRARKELLAGQAMPADLTPETRERHEECLQAKEETTTLSREEEEETEK